MPKTCWYLTTHTAGTCWKTWPSSPAMNICSVGESSSIKQLIAPCDCVAEPVGIECSINRTRGRYWSISRRTGVLTKRAHYLLLDDAQAKDESSRLRVTAILDRIAQLPDEQLKILIFDCTAIDANWNLGVLENEFARSLQSCETRIANIPNLVVLCASSPDEQGWDCGLWRRTVFGHFLLKGLQGNVNDTNHDGRIDVWDLYAGTRDATERWAMANRAARQTPLMLPQGKLGFRRARAIDLVPAVHDPSSHGVPVTGHLEIPQEVVQAWKTHERLANQVPSPATYSPIAWRQYRDLLIRYEQLRLADNQTAAARVRQRMQQCQLQIERNTTCDIASIQNSLAMFTALASDTLPIASSLSTNSTLTSATTADPHKSLETLWNAPPAQRLKKWDNIRNAAGSGETSLSRLRMNLQHLIIQRVIEDPAANLQHGADLIQLLDDPLHPRPAESHFLVMLARDLPPSRWDDRRRDLVRLALQTRLLAERTAWGLRDVGYAYPERVVPRITKLVEAADKQRRQGEDLLLGDPNDYGRSEHHFREAQRQMRVAARQAAARAGAMEVHDRVVADLWYYARSIARRRPDLRDNRNLQQTRLVGLERICRGTHQLEAILQSLPAAGDQQNVDVTPLVTQTQSLANDVAQLQQALQESWQLLTSSDSPQAWCDLTDALLIPQRQSSLRVKLLSGLIHNQERLAADATERMSHPLQITSKQQAESAKWSAQAEGRMALATLGQARYETLSRGATPTYAELQHRLQVFGVEERWWQSVTTAGLAIGNAWQAIPQEMNKHAEAADKVDRQEALPLLATASKWSRVVPGAYPLSLKREPAQVARHARLQTLLQWQAGRAYDDHWYGEDPAAEPYYRRVAQIYLDDIPVLNERWKTAKEITGKLTAVGGLQFTATGQLDMTSQPVVNVPVQLAPTTPAKIPPGFPVIWFEAGTSLALDSHSQHRIAWPWQPAAKTQPAMCEISSPALQQAERAPLANQRTSDTSLALHGRYRGQIISQTVPVRLHLAPELANAQYGPPTRASLAVRAGAPIQQRYGEGSGSVAVVLDCTGSMGPPEGQPFTAHTKYTEATSALGRVLAQLPQGTTLSVWVFGQAIGPSKTVAAPEATIRRILDPITWNPRDPEQLRDLMMRIEYPALEPWNESPIVRAILAAKQDLAGKPGFKTIVVVTDGMDNRVQHDKEINPQGKHVPTLLRDAFDKSGIELNIIGFRMQAEEAAQGAAQFKVVRSLSPPGQFCTVSESESLAEALDTALRQQLRYWIDPLRTPGARQSIPVAMDVSETGTNDQWYPGGLAPGNYLVALNAANKIETPIALNRGDRLLLQLLQTNSGLKLQNVVYGQEDFPWKPFAISQGWRATLLQNQYLPDTSLRMLLGLETNGISSGSTLSVGRPVQSWIELTTDQSSDQLPPFQWCRSWGYPIATWNIAAPSWPNSDAQHLARPKIRMWWSMGDNVSPDAVLRRGSEFHSLSDLAGRQIATGQGNIMIESTSVEDHFVQVGSNLRQVRKCLVIRLRHTPSQTIWVRPVGLENVGQEHRFYRKIGQYTGLFWPVTPDSVHAALQRLELVTLDSFQQSAAQRGNLIELEKLPPPDPGDVGPRPIEMPHEQTKRK